MINTYGYEDGLVSNSMLQAAIVCPLKYKLAYIDRKKPYDGKLFDATSIGTVVHKCLELHEDDPAAALVVFWDQIRELVGDTLASDAKSLMRLVLDARAETQEEGKKWGREYKAPEMTSFWKKRFSGLDRLLDGLDKKVEAYVEGSVWDISFSKLVMRGLISLKNWPSLRLGEPIAAEMLLKDILGKDGQQTAMVGTVDRLESRGENKVAVCDYKTGAWAYDLSKVKNSDQFGTYHRLIETQRGLVKSGEFPEVVEWVLYDLFANQVIRYEVEPEALAAFDARLEANLEYFKQVSSQFGNVAVPIPAGSSYRNGCPCVFALSGDCHFYIK